ncbi:MAG: trypsin-like peptidase domain-containing protein [Chthonomonas sp.]|nr:trypsin-like peptidase domain-containing protein [Chthonomonas sp.]
MKPALWIGLGVCAGVVATGSFLTGTGFRPAFAQRVPQTSVVRNEPSGSPMALLRQMDQAFADVSESVAPSVVHIKVGGQANAPTTVGQPDPTLRGQGSGFIFRADGWIITNDHVVEGAKEVTVVFNDGREMKGTVRSSGDSRNDIALVKVEAKELPAAKLADSGTIRVGEFALAFGAPFGLENSVTVGHISALGRTSLAGGGASRTVRSYAGMIQTDAPINPGNSGGPLVNIYGEVIGVNTSIYNSGGGGLTEPGNVGIGFAIPSNQVRLIADRLISKGKLERGFLGVVPGDLTPYEKSQRKIEQGAVLRDVQEGTPAYAGGLRKGDVVTEIQGVPVRGQQDLLNAMLDLAPGNKAEVKYVRNATEQSTKVTIGSSPIAQAEPQQSSPLLPQFPRLWGQEDNQDDPNQLFPNQGEKAPAPNKATIGSPAKIGVMVKVLDDADRKNFNIPAGKKGALITSVSARSVAEQFGLKPGDLIVKLNGQDVATPDDVTRAMQGKKVGDEGSMAIENYEDGLISRSFTFTF